MSTWKSLPERLPIYAYPVFLLAIEFMLKSLASLEIQPFIGPTLAAVGASFTLPLLIRRPVTVEKLRKYPQIVKQLEKLHQQGQAIQFLSRTEMLFIQICLTCTFLLTVIWIWTLYLSIKFPTGLWWHLPSNLFPGFINYIIGIVLSEIREAI
jgi:hypothetical protein